MISFLSQEPSGFEEGIIFSNDLYKELWKGSKSSDVHSKAIPGNLGLGQGLL